MRATVALLFIAAFTLNFMGHKKLLTASSEQNLLDDCLHHLEPSSPQAGARGKAIEVDTAIIITSSWIPTHPSTYMVDTVVNSTIARLKGLSPDAPIVITVDHFRSPDGSPGPKEKLEQLEGYTVNLFNNYMTDARVHVVPGAKHLHIGGSVMKALTLVGAHYPAVRYVYSLQHDFAFVRDIDHAALVNAMVHHEEINWVRLGGYMAVGKGGHRGIPRTCGDRKPIECERTVYDPEEVVKGKVPTLTLYPTSEYSDNNHIARYGWYRDLIASLIKLGRPPEDPLRSRANNGCANITWKTDNVHGLYLHETNNIGHLDGRHTAG